MSKTMLFNPYTGTPRHPSDIASDPQGILILDPDAPLLAATPHPAPTPASEPAAQQRVLLVEDEPVLAKNFPAVIAAKKAAERSLSYYREMTGAEPAAQRAAEGEPIDCRSELVTAIHFLASSFENSIYAFRDDAEALKKAKGDIGWAMSVAARWNWNGAPAPQPAEPSLSDAELDALANNHFVEWNNLTPHQWRSFARAALALRGGKVGG